MTPTARDDALLARALDALPSAVLVVSPGDYRILAVSDGYLAGVMRTREALLGQPAFAMFPADPSEPDAPHVRLLRASAERAEATRAPDVIPSLRYPVEIDGQFVERTWRIVNAPVLDDAGRVVALIHTNRDITDLPEAEAAADAQVRATFDSAAVGIAIGTADGVIATANEAVCGKLGYREAELVGRRIAEVIHPDDLAEAGRRYREVVGGTRARDRYRARFIRTDGAVRWMRVSLAPLRTGVGTAPRVVAVIEDITAEHEASAALRESATLMRLAGRLAKVGGSVVYPDGRVYWSDEIAEMLEYPPGTQFALDEALAMYPDAWRPVIAGAIGTALADGTPVDVTVQLRTRTGRLLWVRIQGEVERAEDGTITRLVGAVQDVTEQTAAAQRVTEQAALLDETSDAIIVRDLEHRLLFWNRGAERLYGWAPGEVLGRVRYRDGFPDLAVFDAAMAEVQARGEWAGELQQRTRDGRVVTVFSRWTLRRDADGRPTSVLVIDSDVTERRQLERQFLRSQRLESLGTLAGGIAHDLNNALAPILMGVEFLREDPPPGERAATLDTLEASARRGAAMVRQVLTFARGIEGERAAMDVTALVGEVAKIAEETFLKGVEIVRALPDGLPPVLGDVTQLHQVLVNLSVNARDAMPDGGRLTFAAAVVSVPAEGDAAFPELRPGGYVRVEVRDSGQGIPPEVLDRVFEPFFTTKALGEGTGLGLSTAKSIVEGHGGAIRVESPPGLGTAVRVWLPVAPAGSAVGTGEVPALPRGRGETILVVDDEPAVRDITRRTLERFGYQVVAAGGAAEALEHFARRPGAIAAVLTDLMMPGMDGVALIAELRRLDPVVRVIAASGLQGQAAGSRGGLPADVRFLAKPYGTQELLQVVAEVVGEG